MNRSNAAPRGKTPPPRSATPQRGRGARQAPQENDADWEIREFLEGLLEGFRAAAAANAAQGNTGPRQPKWFETDGDQGGKAANWSDLNELEKTLPKFSSSVQAYREDAQAPAPSLSPGGGGYGGGGASPSRGYGGGGGRTATPKAAGFATDPLSTMMRRHALRAFLEEMCGSVAKAFEQMASLAVKNSLGGQGGIGLPDQRMKYKFSPAEFQKTLSHLGYGVGAGTEWWRALFRSIDVDEDGAVSLQDMYDALVLDLPPAPGQGAGGSVFLSGADGLSPSRTVRVSPSPGQRTFSPLGRTGSPLGSTWESNAGAAKRTNLMGGFDNQCDFCGAGMSGATIFCGACGTRRPD